MNKVIFSTILFLSLQTHANELTGWAWGVGFGVKSGVQSSINLDIKSPQLWGEQTLGSLLLSVAQNETVYDRTGRTDSALMNPVRLLAEFRRPLYKETASSYWRIGGGYMFADEVLHTDRGFAIIPVQFGLDVIIGDNGNGSISTFFAQVGFDIAFNLPAGSPSDKLNGTEAILGVRLYY